MVPIARRKSARARTLLSIGIAAVILSVVWLANGLWLGRKQDAMAAEETQLAEVGCRG